MKFHLEPTSTYSLEDIYDLASSQSEYISHLEKVAKENNYDYDESSINLAFDDGLLSQAEKLVSKKVSSNLKYIFVVGIGGSNLGTKAIYDIFYSYRDWVSEDRPKMVFVDTVNDNYLHFYIEALIGKLSRAEEYLLVSISKSGGTTETIANTEILAQALAGKFSDQEIKDRTVVITDEGSAFWQAAEEAGIDHLALPKLVGGRYSVLSAVGIFPLLALGFDVKGWREGAKEMRAIGLLTDVKENLPLLSAAVMAKSLKEGKVINDTFVFNGELESMGKWYRQLLGESIGKEYDLDGEVVNTGITPTVSVGSVDLHSVAQLYLGGPKDKLTTFVYTFNEKESLNIPDQRIFPEIVKMVDGKNTTDIMKAILGGVKAAYKKNQLPFVEVEFESLSARELGAFMQFKMMEMMYLGRLLNVNPFDQPNVESYKIETKALLES